MNVSRQFFFLAVVLLVFILAILMAGHVHNFDKHNFANPPVNSFFNIFIIFQHASDAKISKNERVLVVVVVGRYDLLKKAPIVMYQKIWS